MPPSSSSRAYFGQYRPTARGRFDDSESLLSAIMRWPLDYLLFIPLLAMLGVIALYSSTLTNPGEADLYRIHFERFWLGFIVMIALGAVRPKWWMAVAWPAYGVGIVLLFAVFIFGVEGGEARRWLEMFSFTIQPSELMKIALVLGLARYYQSFEAQEENGLWVHMGAFMLALLPAGLVALQPDLGTSLSLVACGVTIIYFAGIRWHYLFALLTLAMATMPLAYFGVLEPYQRARVDTYIAQILGKDDDGLGASYQIEQARIAIGSGGFFGKGLTNGTQSQLDYIPEQHTDFILTVIAEEMGFLGVMFLMSVWAWIFARAMYFANLSLNAFSRYGAIGAAALVAFYVVFNTGMVFGLFPVVGIPMPLISYGGSAMMTVLFAFALIGSARIHRNAGLR